jgi:hypothetical protein
MECTVTDCTSTIKSTGYCAHHLRKHYKYGDALYVRKFKKDMANPCSVEGCEKRVQARSLCLMHYRRWSLYGDPLITKVDPEHRGINNYKYVVAYGHPNANHIGKIMEHRLVMSQMIGRPLEPNENVHHKNGNRSDNRPENLELWNTSQPAGQRPADKVEYAIMILGLYAPELLAKEG